MDVYDSVVIGAGQAGLSASYHLERLGIRHVVLDAGPRPGGAWQHRWDSLTMRDVHGVADLPDGPAPGRSADRANRAVPAWFGRYEAEHDLPVRRPVRVRTVTGDGGLLRIDSDAGAWLARTLVNATGTWDRPFVPHYPGVETFRGEQVHTHDYPGPDHFRGKRVLVVGGGASAVQFLGEIGPITDTLWVTRREPVWRDEFDENAGREAVARVLDRVTSGFPPASVVSVTGLALRPQEETAARLGVYDRRRTMFSRVEPDGVRWDDDVRDPARPAFEPVDTILWATGFRPAVTHLAPLHLRSEHGGIPLLPGTADVQTAVTAARDPRVQLVGYGPSASTIGGNRGGRAAALAVRRHLTDRLVRLDR
ncbi:FAD-dependent oxidoreductase [Myceligenerans salitolerans]|uniref:NAD(P)/FAD-dependent oxidoreductase n=1 Tax=Myceligenerans salitolerans TaxID=1230528 RepID=A0ABS3IED3_9MICO|nr:FAD-dependent oxidoreductase [Myceligenerans salitolerans]MBO0610798.1 NAD(P)/FAD-dependent oxidoreductase [Myceligenerans salitolerans]